MKAQPQRRLPGRQRKPRWATRGEPSGIVTLTTDFGNRDPYVGIMKGVLLERAPRAKIVDLTHEVPPQDVTVGALMLRSAVRYFPEGTIHVAVVDPGVGSARRPIIAISDRGILIGPDNGLLYPSAMVLGAREVRLLERRDLFVHPVSRTFHGRDIFAPVAGHLVAGHPPASVGRAIDDMQQLDLPRARNETTKIIGEVISIDHFGNLVTNVEMAGLQRAAGAYVETGGQRIDGIAPSYSSVAAGELLAIGGSWGLLEIAVNEGNAAQRLGLQRGAEVTVHLETGDR